MEQSEIAKKQYWMRLAVCIQASLKKALLGVLHNTHGSLSYKGLPADKALLYQELDKQLGHRRNDPKLNVIKPDMWDILLPPCKKETDATLFDVTLITILIRHCTNLPPPLPSQTVADGWKQKFPQHGDTSVAGNCLKAREFRNKIFHSCNNNISKTDFLYLWSELEDILRGLKCNDDTKEFKEHSLDPYLKTQLDALEIRVNYLKEQGNSQKINAMESEMNDIKKRLENVEKEKKDYKSLKIAFSLSQGNSLHNEIINDVRGRKLDSQVCDIIQKTLEDDLNTEEVGAEHKVYITKCDIGSNQAEALVKVHIKPLDKPMDYDLKDRKSEKSKKLWEDIRDSVKKCIAKGLDIRDKNEILIERSVWKYDSLHITFSIINIQKDGGLAALSLNEDLLNAIKSDLTNNKLSPVKLTFGAYTCIDIEYTEPIPLTVMNDVMLCLSLMYVGLIHETKTLNKIKAFTLDHLLDAWEDNYTSKEERRTTQKKLDEPTTEESSEPVTFSYVSDLILNNVISRLKNIISNNPSIISMRDAFNWTLYHEASRRNKPEILKLFIDAGTDFINGVRNNNFFGMTPLMWASHHNYTECVRVLVQHGADVNVMNKYGKTAYNLTDSNEIKRMLRENMYGISSDETVRAQQDIQRISIKN